MLKKQNSSLSATLTNTRRELADTKMQVRTDNEARSTLSCLRRAAHTLACLPLAPCPPQLEYATAKLATRDNSLSIFNRQWAQLEEQLALLLGRLDGRPLPPAAGPSSGGLAALSTPVAPLVADAAAADEALQARCARMQDLGRMLVERTLGGGGSATAAAAPDVDALESERNGLRARLELFEDRCARAEAMVTELTERAGAAAAEADRAVKALHRDRFQKEYSGTASAPATGAKPEGEQAASAVATAATAGGGGGVETVGASAALAEVMAELEASQQQAQQWLAELQEVQTELARARAEQHEALLKPPDETQLRLHPAYKKLHAHAKEMSDRAQVAEARVQQFRTDAAALNTMRHREQATFDEYRERLASQVGDETKHRSVELAAALADRRTIELQLAQLSMSQRREAERGADLDSRLRFALREQQRAADEIARLRELVASREAERDASRSQELERTKETSAAQSLVDSLRKAAEANGATIEPNALEKELHDALGRIRGAELKASHAELDLRKVKGAQEALMAEIEAVTQTYEEVQAKNDELRQTISLKDDALARAKGDKLRADSLAAMLKQEHALLQTKVSATVFHGSSTDCPGMPRTATDMSLIATEYHRLPPLLGREARHFHGDPRPAACFHGEPGT